MSLVLSSLLAAAALALTSPAGAAWNQLETLAGRSREEVSRPPFAAAPVPEQAGVPGLCRVLSFEVSADGWTGDREPIARTPCRVAPVAPQPTCLQSPCFNTACRAVLRYRALVELDPGETRLWPSCYFKQQRLGRRSHQDGERRVLDQFEPRPTLDFEGSVEANGLAFSKRPVPGRPGHFEVEFYDLPGWAAAYWTGRPNATAPRWFPLDFRYMYRAYLGPKRRDISEEDYRYAGVDMEARVSPAAEIERGQRAGSPADWSRFQRELDRVGAVPIDWEGK